MTRDEILNMPAGREMDALIEVYVLGDDGTNATGKHYSADISCAWEVVEKMNKQYGADIEIISHHPGRDCMAHFWNCDPDMSIEHLMDDFVARAETVPLAICRAALLATMNEGDSNDA